MKKKTERSYRIGIGLFLILVGGYLVYLQKTFLVVITGFLLAAIGIAIIAGYGG